MLRITLSTDPTGTTLCLEGRLVGLWVAELERTWRAARVEGESGPLRVNLDSVTYIDATGKELLKRMHHEGAHLIASGCLIRAYLEEITKAG